MPWQRAIDGGESIIIKDHRHMVNLTAPDEVNKHLLAWLKSPHSGTI